MRLEKISVHNQPAGPSGTHGLATVELLVGEIDLSHQPAKGILSDQFIPQKLVGRRATVSISKGECRVIGGTYYFQGYVEQRDFNKACGFMNYDPNVKIMFSNMADGTLLAQGRLIRGKTLTTYQWADPEYLKVWGDSNKSATRTNVPQEHPP